MKKTPNKYMVGLGLASVVAAAAAVAVTPMVKNIANNKKLNNALSMTEASNKNSMS